MNIYLTQFGLFIKLLSVIVVSTLLTATPSMADFRQEAELAVAQLRQNSDAGKFMDDMKSLDLVYEVAERYVSSNDSETADKFFLLALQKSRMIEIMMKESELEDVLFPVDSSLVSGAGLAAEPGSSLLVGSRGVYTVVRGDSLRLVAAKLGVSQKHLRSMNNLEARATVKVGQKLAYNNRKIIPRQMKDGIIVNIPDRTLYYFQKGELVSSLPVAVGSATKNEKYVWQTPVGKFKITAKVKDPVWTVPTSIQTEMEEQGKEVVSRVLPGPENPLGKYAIRTSIPGIMIHSTTKPSSIYGFSSHGCIRLSPNQMREFFPQIRVNTKGEIIYKPVKLAVTEDGRVFLEVHNDIYNKGSNLVTEARQMVEKKNLSHQIDWEKFKTVVTQKNGIAEDITL
ncbi:MAG: L,D-transpeptidase family protein [Desulfuromonadaceae bacterium]|nr:L,D-transpeptidase family protein [Desulfuromonadaceae bacterium]MDD5105580.1 L,D-transpeptidase family protein [Desulfuromonadaceae bacterium]